MTPSTPPDAAILEALAWADRVLDYSVDPNGHRRVLARALRSTEAERDEYSRLADMNGAAVMANFERWKKAEAELAEWRALAENAGALITKNQARWEAAESREKTLIEQADKHDREWERKFNSLRGELAEAEERGFEKMRLAVVLFFQEKLEAARQQESKNGALLFESWQKFFEEYKFDGGTHHVS